MTTNQPHAAEVADCMRRIYAQRLTTTSGGNISVRDASGTIWISGSGIDKATIAQQHVICINPDGSRCPATANFPTRPSSELPFHCAIYDARADIHAIVHAHPAALVSTSLVHRIPDTRLIPSAYRICGAVAWTDYCTPGTGELGARLAAQFSKGYHAALMQNHGVVVGADDLATALCRFETLEFTTRSINAADELQQPIGITSATLSEYEQAFANRPDCHASQGIPPRNVAVAVNELMRRGYQRQLLINGRGSVSTRVSERCFAISNPGHDYGTAQQAALRIRAVDQTTANLYEDWHRQIYATRPDIGAIIHAYPPYATAFALLQRPLIAATIPESYLVLREIQRISMADAQNAATIAKSMTLDTPTALLVCDGALVVGRTLIEAYDRLEVLDSTAETIIRASRMGEVELLDDDDLRGLTYSG